MLFIEVILMPNTFTAWICTVKELLYNYELQLTGLRHINKHYLLMQAK